MTKRFPAVIALVLATCAPPLTPLLAQSAPKLAPCDTAGVLAHAKPVFNVGQSRLNDACPAFDRVLVDFATLNPEFAAAVQRIRHGAPKAPRDTTPATPPVVTPPAPTPVDTVKPAPSVSSWTGVHYAAGARYLIPGYRRARWTFADTTRAVYTFIDGDLQCGTSGFPAIPSGSGSSYCEISQPLLDTIAVPAPMGPITGKSIVVPKGGPGFSTARIQNGGGSGSPSSDGFGAFRTTCTLAKMAFDDPIVYPGKPGASHLHQFFGLANVDAFTDTVSLKKGASTCRGGSLNQTAYWSPAMIDGRGAAVLPAAGVFYYKSFVLGDPTRTQPIPMGLRMVAGNKAATGAQFSPDGLLQFVDWTCLRGTAKSPQNATIPACTKGDTLRLTVYFPSCWDGKNLDAPDHQSHMTYPDHRLRPASCDAAHPLQLPEISEHFDWQSDGNVAAWRLSSDMDPTKPGISGHADWLMGWNADVMKAIVVNCIRKRFDCGVGGTGDNRTLY